ncbi:MAG: hypothetical protein LBT24_00195, partial [Tannerella sp.]|nr:hypothetical protein [Tannerella sp.]
PAWLSGAKILTYLKANAPYLDDISGQYIDLPKMAVTYNIKANNIVGGYATLIDNSTTFNFQNCNISLQGNLNDLASSLKRTGNIEDAELLEEAAEVLESVESCKTPEEVKKKGVLNKVKRILEDLGDKDSKLHKTVEGIKKGIGIAQDIAKGYNSIAQWAGLPQVPTPFLKKSKNDG